MMRRTGWTLVGGGAASLAAGIGSYGVAMIALADLRSELAKPERNGSRIRAARQSFEIFRYAGAGLAGLGVAAALSGLTLVSLAPRRPDPRVHVALTPGGVVVEGSF